MEGGRLKIARWLLFAIVFVATTPTTFGLTVSCMMEYDGGGAPAVCGSPECGHQWLLARGTLQNQTLLHSCQFATLQGRREYQEDRIACKLDCEVSLPDACGNGLELATVAVIAIFDGHGGKEASELASELLFDYFHLHVAFQSYKVMLENKGVLSDCGSPHMSPHGEILKEALLKTIYDIELKFSQEATKNNFYSGSTATIALLYDKQFLVANVGDSKALLFSKKVLTGLGADGEMADEATAHLSAIELTVDHHPDRKDERNRIEAAGGSVIGWGVPRVNGILAMSRSIGDLYLKKHGVIAEPEFTDWQHLTANDRYLVVTSDGIFESLTKEHIADLIMEWNSHVKGNLKIKLSSSSCLSFSSLAECIVNVAYERGSHDNLSVIVVPLGIFLKYRKMWAEETLLNF